MSPVSDVRWIPGSESLFLASHMDGTLIVYDKEREDAAFVPEENNSGHGEKKGSASEQGIMHITKSVNSKNQKVNPVAAWKLSNQRINAFAFSPDSRHLAVVSEDGSLRIIDYLRETLVWLFSIYGFVADTVQFNGPIYKLLWRLYVRLLVTRWAIRPHRWSG